MLDATNEKYSTTRGSDIDRDGMYLELTDLESKRIVAEIFYSDKTHDYSISCFEADLPLLVIEALISDAKRLLPQVKIKNG